MNQAPVAVIGGGAAGMMAALWAKKSGVPVVLIEPNEKLGRKLYITGKGRCNLTNNTTPEGVLANVPRNGRFLYSAVNRFPPDQVMAYFEALGVPLKTERGGRVFPCSDRAADVIDALFYALKRAGIPQKQDRAVGLQVEDGRVTGVVLTQRAFSSALGGFGNAYVAIILFFFAFSTIIGWYFFGEQNIKYLFGRKALTPYRLLVMCFIVLGSMLKVTLVWELADMFNGLMVLPNLVALIGLAKLVSKALDDYENRFIKRYPELE